MSHDSALPTTCHTIKGQIQFLASSGGQGVTISVCLSYSVCTSVWNRRSLKYFVLFSDICNFEFPPKDARYLEVNDVFGR